MLFSVGGYAVEGGAELDRKLISMFTQGEGELWGDLSYVDDSFDIFGYGSGSSGINYSAGATLGGKYALSDRYNIRAQYSLYQDEAWRSTEPKILKSEYEGVEAVLQDIFWVDNHFDLAWNLGYRSHGTDQGIIRKYQFQNYLVESEVEEGITVTNTATGQTSTVQNIGGGNVSVTGDIVNVPSISLATFGLDSLDSSYLINATPKDEGVGIGLNGAWYPDPDYRITLGSELRYVQLEPNYGVNPDLLQLLEMYDSLGLTYLGDVDSSVIHAQLPQEEGWDETHLLFSVGMDWSYYEDLSVAAQYTYYGISRSGYQSTKGKVEPTVADQTTNHQLDGWLFIKPEKDITLYLHGRAYSNFLLGDRPLLYNARVNHKFTDPYGFVSVGAVWEF